MEEVITEEKGTELVGIAAELESEEEQKLAKKISELWAVHVQTKDVVKKQRKKSKAFVATLNGARVTMSLRA